MNKMIFTTAIAALALGLPAAVDARQKSRAAAEYQSLLYDRDCAGRRVVVGPLWSVPVVGSGAFLVTWDCDFRDYDRADRAVRAFQRKHRIKSE
jgi:hypothetical protein